MSKSAAGRDKSRKRVKDRLRSIADKEFVDFLLIEGISGDRELSAEGRKKVRKEKKERGRDFYSDVLFTLVQNDIGTTKARRTWQNILVHKAKLSAMLGRRIGISVAAMDYFVSFRDLNGEPVIVDRRKIAAVGDQVVNDGISFLRDTATFREKLEMEIYRFRRHGPVLALAMIRVDGRETGKRDKGAREADGGILGSVAEELQRASRRLDIAVRIGCGELALLLPHTRVEEAARVAERIRKRVERRFRRDDKVTVSIGVAGCPENAQKPDSLMRRCEEALSRAIRAGGNCVTAR